MGKACTIAVLITLVPGGLTPLLPQGRTQEKKELPLPAKSDPTEKLLKDLKREDPVIRATAVDLLRSRKAKEAIPHLIELLGDPTPLTGSDNWVGGQAANALAEITGKPFSVDQNEWKCWWKGQQNGREQPTEQIAYGDTPEFWESYALVVAKVIEVKDREEGATRIVSVVTLSIQESVPHRYAKDTRFSMTFQLDWRFGSVRDKPTSATTLEEGNRVMQMVTEEKGQLIHAFPQVMNKTPLESVNGKELQFPTKPEALPVQFRGISSFAMLPSWRLHYPKEEDAVVAETVRVCQALSEKNVARRLELIESLQKVKPSERVQDLLRRRLEVTLETSLREAQGAMRLLKGTGKK